MQTIRGRRQSIDSAFSASSTFRLSASDSCCAERSQLDITDRRSSHIGSELRRFMD
jgi:hypothetical protein